MKSNKKLTLSIFDFGRKCPETEMFFGLPNIKGTDHLIIATKDDL